MCNSPFFDVIMLKQNNFLLLLMIFSITHNIKSEFFSKIASASWTPAQ